MEADTIKQEEMKVKYKNRILQTTEKMSKKKPSSRAEISSKG